MQILEFIIWLIAALCICMVAAKLMAYAADLYFRANDIEYREQHARSGSPPWWPLWWWSLWQDLGLLIFATLLILIVIWLI